MDKLDWFINSVNSLKGSTKDAWITNISENTELADLGLDSLDVVELQMMYEAEFNCEIPDISIPLVTTGDILKLLK